MAEKSVLEIAEDNERTALAVLPHLHGLPVSQALDVLDIAAVMVKSAATFDRECAWVNDARRALRDDSSEA